MCVIIRNELITIEYYVNIGIKCVGDIRQCWIAANTSVCRQGSRSMWDGDRRVQGVRLGRQLTFPCLAMRSNSPRNDHLVISMQLNRPQNRPDMTKLTQMTSILTLNLFSNDCLRVRTLTTDVRVQARVGAKIAI